MKGDKGSADEPLLQPGWSCLSAADTLNDAAQAAVADSLQSLHTFEDTSISTHHTHNAEDEDHSPSRKAGIALIHSRCVPCKP